MNQCSLRLAACAVLLCVLGAPAFAEPSNQTASVPRPSSEHEEKLASLLELNAELGPADRPELRGAVEKNIGQTLIALDQRERANDHFQAARKLYENTEVTARRLELYPLLVDNLEALGRPGEALAVMREYQALGDQSRTGTSTTRVAELESQLEQERLARQQQATRAEEDMQRASRMVREAREDRQLIIQLVLGTLLLALVAGLVLARRKRRLAGS